MKFKMNYFNFLPEEIILIIFLFTDFESCIHLKLVCQQFNRIITKDFLLNFCDKEIHGFIFNNKIILHGKVPNKNNQIKYFLPLVTIWNSDNMFHDFLYYDFGNLVKAEKYYIKKMHDQLFLIQFYKNNQLNGLYEQYHENGSLDIRTYHKNGKLNGTYQEYYKNGKSRVRTYFINGLKNGVYQEYYDNGNQKTEAYYIKNKKNGLCKTYYTNGQLTLKIHFKDDKYNNSYESYHTDGSLNIKCYYMCGKLNGPYEQYLKNGTLYTKTNFINGKKICDFGFKD